MWFLEQNLNGAIYLRIKTNSLLVMLCLYVCIIGQKVFDILRIWLFNLSEELHRAEYMELTTGDAYPSYLNSLTHNFQKSYIMHNNNRCLSLKIWEIGRAFAILCQKKP